MGTIFCSISQPTLSSIHNWVDKLFDFFFHKFNWVFRRRNISTWINVSHCDNDIKNCRMLQFHAWNIISKTNRNTFDSFCIVKGIIQKLCNPCGSWGICDDIRFFLRNPYKFCVRRGWDQKLNKSGRLGVEK